MADTVATATFQGADVDWYIKADDIVLKGKKNQMALIIYYQKINSIDKNYMI